MQLSIKQNKYMKNAEKTVETKLNKPTTTTPVMEYDGYETWEEKIHPAQPAVTKTVKVNMNSEEVKKFFGEYDPKLYFKHGKIPTWMKEYGVILDEDEEETKLLRSVTPTFPELILFKHKNQPLYNVLVPKPLSEFELDSTGEISNENYHADFRAIAFGGSNAPRNYDKTYFKLRAEVIARSLQRGAERIKEWRAHKSL